MIPFEEEKEHISSQEMITSSNGFSSSFLPSFPLLPSCSTMEDLNMIAADCVVISCCCQCLILQVLIFIMLKLPYKLFRKTRHYAKKLTDRKRGKNIMQRRRCNELNSFWSSEDGSFRVHVEGFFLNGNHGCCMDEVEKVMEEFSLRGDFAFGSFWDGEISKSFPSCPANNELDYDVVHRHLIQIFGSNFNFREQEIIDAF